MRELQMISYYSGEFFHHPLAPLIIKEKEKDLLSPHKIQSCMRNVITRKKTSLEQQVITLCHVMSYHKFL